MGKPFVSICIITGGNPTLLDACIESIQNQQDPPPFEVLVSSNGGTDVSELVHARLPDAAVDRVKGTRLGAARNPLVQRACGEWLLFLDDDVTVGPGFLRELQRLASEHPRAAVLGGPNQTPPGTPLFDVVQGSVLASIVVSGPVRRRYGPHPPGPADERFFTLCNLAIRRSEMVSFPPELIGAEENAVLVEMYRRGLAMHYDPALSAFHDRRPTLRSFAAQMFKYGLGRGQLSRKSPQSLRAAYLLPTSLLIYLAVLAVVGWLYPPLAAGLVIYLASLGATGLKIAWDLRRFSPNFIGIAGTAVILAFTVHLYYGLGFLRGLTVPSRPSAPAGAPQPSPEAAVAAAAEAVPATLPPRS